MTTQRRIYRVMSNSVDEINSILSQIADRLDAQEGWRGTPLFKANVDFDGNRGTNTGAAILDDDFIQQGQTDTKVNTAVANILRFNKPVGTIHPTVDPDNPADYLGYGTWEAFGTGKFLVGIDPSNVDFDTVEETGTFAAAGGSQDYIVIYLWKRTA